MQKPHSVQSSPLLLLAALCSLSFIPANAATLVNDPFLTGGSDYTVGNLPGQNPTVTGFSGGWVGTNPPFTVSATGLSYSDPNYTAPTGGSVVTSNNRDHRNFGATTQSALSTTANGTVYMSILANFSGGTGAWNYAAFELGTGGIDAQKALAIGIDTIIPGNFMYQVNNGTKTSLGIASNTTTNLFLLKLNLSSTALTDSFTVWINPTLGGSGDPTGGVTVSGLNLFAMNAFQFGSGAANNRFDEIRLGNTLADVGIVPEPATGGLLGLGALGTMVARRRRKLA